MTSPRSQRGAVPVMTSREPAKRFSSKMLSVDLGARSETTPCSHKGKDRPQDAQRKHFDNLLQSRLRRWTKLVHKSSVGAETLTNCAHLFRNRRQLVCRFSDAGMARPSSRWEGRRPKSAKARNRGVWGADGAAGAMGIWRRRECWGS